jgi:hypothetical protein
MKRLVLSLAAVAVAASAFGVAVAAPAGKTDAEVIGNVKIDAADPGVAYVTARYVCQPGAPDSTAAAHLWVSVKQTASRLPENVLKTPESSSVSAGWVQSHPTAQVVCDGQWHTDTFVVNHDEYGPTGDLATGQGYVQFCLFGGDGTFVSSQRFAVVK